MRLPLAPTVALVGLFGACTNAQPPTSTSTNGGRTTGSTSTGGSSGSPTTGGSSSGGPNCPDTAGWLFASGTTFFTDAGPSYETDLVLGDFDHDGNLDIAMAHLRSIPSDYLPGDVGIFFGAGNGSLDPLVEYSSIAGFPNLFYSPLSAFAATLGSPPRTALIVNDLGSDSQTGSHLTVATIDTNRALSVTAQVPITSTFLDPGVLSVADLNLDGIPDFVVGTRTSGLEVLLGTDAGTWALGGYISEYASNQTNNFTGDFNEDGSPDIIVSTGGGHYGHESLSILLGNGDGTFSNATVIATDNDVGGFGSVFLFGDLNEDGHLDIMVNYAWQLGPNSWAVLLGKGDGTFTVGPSVSSLGGIGNIVVGIALRDLNADGHLDFVGVANDMGLGIRVALGNGDGTFQPWFDQIIPDDGGASGVAIGDVDNDGRPDLVVSDGTGESVTIYLNKCH